MFGRMMSESLARWHFWFTFIGTYAIFMPMHYLGMAGHPRRYSAINGTQLSPWLGTAAKFTYAAFRDHRGPVHFLVQSLLEYEGRQEG